MKRISFLADALSEKDCKDLHCGHENTSDNLLMALSLCVSLSWYKKWGQPGMQISKMPPVYFPTCRHYEVRGLRLYLSLFLDTGIIHFKYFSNDLTGI